MLCCHVTVSLQPTVPLHPQCSGVSGRYHTPAILAVLEAGLLSPNIRLERLSVLYGLRVKNLPDNHPVKKAIKETSLLTETRPLSNGVKILMPKEQT